MRFSIDPARYAFAVLLVSATLLTGCQVMAPQVGQTQYTRVSWNDLPAASDQDWLTGFAAWRAGCAKLNTDPIWAEPCRAARHVPLTPVAVRTFLRAHMDVFALSVQRRFNGLITGYFEPIYPGSLFPSKAAHVPIYGVPTDLVQVALGAFDPKLNGKKIWGRLERNPQGGWIVKPYNDSAEIARQGVDAPILAWLKNPLDLQFLQIQGSGRIQLANGQQLRVAYAGQNGRPYRAVGRWLVEHGALTVKEVNMQSIRAWANVHPNKLPSLLAANPSYIFFKLKPNSEAAPDGALGVPLSAGYSVAVDPRAVPLGSLMWLATTTPDGMKLVRPVAAQDTGGAIKGGVRADVYFGTGDAAGAIAGQMKQAGRLWLIWPKGRTVPANDSPVM